MYAQKMIFSLEEGLDIYLMNTITSYLWMYITIFFILCKLKYLYEAILSVDLKVLVQNKIFEKTRFFQFYVEHIGFVRLLLGSRDGNL